MKGTSGAGSVIFQAAKRGAVSVEIQILKAGQRLDHIASEYYGDGRLWWVIAAASGIGWAPQCSPGTVLTIPTDINEIRNLVG